MQELDQGDLPIDIQALMEEHGEEEINKIMEAQLRQLQKNLPKAKGKGISQGQNPTSSRNLGIKTNPLKDHQKKTLGEEKKRGWKSHKQKLYETGALLVN